MSELLCKNLTLSNFLAVCVLERPHFEWEQVNFAPESKHLWKRWKGLLRVSGGSFPFNWAHFLSRDMTIGEFGPVEMSIGRNPLIRVNALLC